MENARRRATAARASKGRLGAVACVGLIGGALLAGPTTATASRIPDDTYKCYVFLSYPVYTGLAIKITGAKTYKYGKPGKLKKGRYKHTTGEKLKFTSGPLDKTGYKGLHRHFDDGTDGVEIIFPTDAGENGNHTCSPG